MAVIETVIVLEDGHPNILSPPGSARLAARRPKTLVPKPIYGSTTSKTARYCSGGGGSILLTPGVIAPSVAQTVTVPAPA